MTHRGDSPTIPPQCFQFSLMSGNAKPISHPTMPSGRWRGNFKGKTSRCFFFKIQQDIKWYFF